ncbi:MAG: winged helix-turn-helix domain-containing protein [Deltaproteobacteria bacterium]|nr:winged helix-turn-helix domain-containing protein [Deltaproteobacteria bacterium]
MTRPIGETVGKVWKFLDEKGEVTLNQMKNGIKADPNLVPQAIGWLACEEKLIIEKKDRFLTYSLKK